MEISKQQDIIPIIFSDIESKRKIINEYRSRFPSNVDTITLNAFEFFDIIDEFEITISQSLQAMQTLQTEIWNLQEKNQNNIIYNEIIGNTMLNDSSKLYFDYSQVKGYSQLINSNISDDVKKSDEDVKKIKKDLMCKESNIVVTENEEEEKEDPHIEEEKEDNNNHILSNIQETDSTNAINEVHMNTKIPIRQSLRQMIKSGKKNIIDTNTNKEHKENNNEEKIKNLLTKIGSVERYRIYFADKYGEGDYDVFINKLNSNEIEKDVLLDELTIIADLMTKQLDEGKRKDNIKRNSNNNIRTHKRTKEVVKSNAYIEPVKFSSYLRNGDDYKGKSKKKNMSFSKEKIYK